MNILEEIKKFGKIIDIVLDLAESVAEMTKTDIDDKTIAVIRDIVKKITS